MPTLLRSYLVFLRQRPWLVCFLVACLGIGLWLWLGRAIDYEKIGHLIAKAQQAQKAAKTPSYVAYYLPKAGLILAGLSFLVLAAAPWLFQPTEEPPYPPPLEGDPPCRKILPLVVLFCVIWSAVMNAPRLSHSLWGDEESTMRRCVVGEYIRDKSGELKWEPVTWQDAAYFYKDPNNHPLYSLLAKASHTLLPATADPRGFYFNELALRLPAYLAGLLGIVLLARLSLAWGMAQAGIGAVVLLTLHPYFVRYGVDARGYALLFPLLPAMLLALTQALQRGRWRAWLAWGVCQFLVVWAYPGALYALVAGNLAAVGQLIWGNQRSPKSWRLAQWKRWLVANALGGVLTTLALLPCVPPMLLYLQRERIRGTLTWPWMQDALSWLATGRAWHRWADHALATDWQGLSRTSQVALVLAFLLVFTLGIWQIWKRGGTIRLLLLAILAPIPLLLLFTVLGGNILYYWYFLIGFPGVLLVLGAGAATLIPRLPVCLPLPLIAFGFLTWRPCRLLRKHSVEPNRESVEAMRPIRNIASSDLGSVMTIGFVFQTRGYDPAARMVATVEELKAALAEADAKRIPAYVHFGHYSFAKQHYPEIINYLQDSGLFEPARIFYGQDVPCTRFVYRYHKVEAGKSAP